MTAAVAAFEQVYCGFHDAAVCVHSAQMDFGNAELGQTRRELRRQAGIKAFGHNLGFGDGGESERSLVGAIFELVPVQEFAVRRMRFIYKAENENVLVLALKLLDQRGDVARVFGYEAFLDIDDAEARGQVKTSGQAY